MAFAAIGTALGASAAAATAVGAGATLAGGTALASGVSAIGSNQRRKSRERELDQFAKQSPLYTPSKSIQEYYQQALNRYNENPYQSQQYKMGAMNAQRATAQGIGALQDRRSAIGGISRLAAGQENAMQNLGVQAEAQRSSRFGQLGGASQMQAAEQSKAFDINKMTPYNRQFGLKQMKAQAANEEYTRDVNNTYSALSNLTSVVGAGQSNIPASAAGPSSKETFDSWMSNPSLKPQINSNYIPKTQGLAWYKPKIY